MLMKMRYQMKKGRNQKGFTLVELMVVVVIIGILSAIAVPVYSNVTEKAEKSAVEANLRTIDGAIMMYYTDEDNLDIIAGDTVGTLVTEGYLASPPTGPGTYKIKGTAPKQVSTVTVTIGEETFTDKSLADLKADTNW